jgi:hypothetical protein
MLSALRVSRHLLLRVLCRRRFSMSLRALSRRRFLPPPWVLRMPRVLRLPCRLLLVRILHRHSYRLHRLHRLHRPLRNRLSYRPFDHNTEPWIKERWNSRERFS